MIARAFPLPAPGCQVVGVEDVLERLEAHGCRPRRRGNGVHIAHCPAHDDRRASLSLTEGDDVPFVAHCHAGCDYEDIRAALGVDSRALGPFKQFRSSGGSLAQLVTPDSPPCVSELLAAHEAGVLQPVLIVLELPPRAGRVMRAVAADLELLFGLRMAVGYKRSLPYAGDWAADRLRENPGSVRRALDALVGHGAIGRAGVLPPLNGRSRGTTKYRLPSVLARRVDVPSRERARERASRVAAVGRVEPLPELHHGDCVAIAELGRAPIEVAERRLLAVGGRAGDLVVVVGAEASAEAVEVVHGAQFRSLRGAA